MFRNEIVNPQFARRNFECLNGKWRFVIKNDGVEILDTKIEVPFCPESEFSGIGYKDFIKECEYERTFQITKINEDERITICFGAVDYEAWVYVNGKLAGKHRGGYTPFAVEVTDLVVEGENFLKVKVYDDTVANQPTGKQSMRLEPYRCFYTRTTGIWQTVWIERTPKQYLKSVKFYPNVEKSNVAIELVGEVEADAKIEIFYQGKLVGKADTHVKYKNMVEVALSEKHLWEPGKGRLYDVTIKFGEDVVDSYFGLREVKFDGYKFLVNGKSVFQRFVLDQGYYPKGQYTPIDVKQFSEDIDLCYKLGFNGARLHQKVFEPRYLYECDKKGFMVWGEFPSWGTLCENLEGYGDFIGEWIAVVERDFNHPSIITWCPLNETWYNFYDDRKIRDVRFVDAVYQTTKIIDKTRPCVDVSGGYHGNKTDLFDVHCYLGHDILKKHIENLQNKDIITTDQTFAPLWTGENIPYKGEPVNVSEYGGIAYRTDGSKGWGYKASCSEEEFVQNYINLTKSIMDSNKISGFCYTQLYDVEQEQNGLADSQRRIKVSEEGLKRILACNNAKAKIEE